MRSAINWNTGQIVGYWRWCANIEWAAQDGYHHCHLILSLWAFSGYRISEYVVELWNMARIRIQVGICCLQSFLNAISRSIVTPFRVTGMYNSRYRFMKLYWYENKGFFIWWKDNALYRSIVVGSNEDGHWLLHRLVFSDCESIGRSIDGLRWSQGIARVQREGLRGRYEGHFER